MDNPRRKSRYKVEKILSLLEQHRSDLANFGVRKIGLFGSYRRGDFRPDSDMDFVVVFERPTFDNYMNVKLYLEDLFGREVDLVLEDAIKPRLRSQILSEVVYASGY